MRREWIEIAMGINLSMTDLSPSMRSEWIEILIVRIRRQIWTDVSLHAEGVD